MHRVSFALAAVFAFAGCSNSNSTETKPAEPKAPEPTATKPAEATPPAPKQPEAQADADYVWVWASHAEAKPGDPVKVAFERFAITESDVDPANLEGATAELEIDLASLSSGLPKRDGHLKTPDYLDVASHPKAVVKIGDVKKQTDTTYTASAEVTAHGITKSLPVEFEVIGKDADSVTIKATKAFSRADFGVGKADGDPVAPELKIEMQLTLDKA